MTLFRFIMAGIVLFTLGFFFGAVVLGGNLAQPPFPTDAPYPTDGPPPFILTEAARPTYTPDIPPAILTAIASTPLPDPVAIDPTPTRETVIYDQPTGDDLSLITRVVLTAISFWLMVMG